MTDCKHDWHFIMDTDRLRCRRCHTETGSWLAEQVTVPTGQLHIADLKPNYNITLHRHGQEIGKLDFNGPELVFEGDAAESAKVFIDWVANTFHGRLKEEREAAYDQVLQDIKEMRPATKAVKDKDADWWLDRFEEAVKRSKAKHS